MGTKDKIFMVHANLTITCSKEIVAGNLVAAAEKASKLKWSDFLPEDFAVEDADEDAFEVTCIFS